MAQVFTSPLSARSALPADCRTIGSLIRRHAAIRPQHTAVVAPGFPPCSYAELQQHIERIGAALHQAGLGRSSRVAILLPSCPELALTGVGVAANAVAVPCNPAVAAVQFEQLHARLGFAAIVLPAWLEPPAWLDNMDGEFAVLRVTRAEASLAEAVISGSERGAVLSRADAADAALDDAALILQTSGTIGPPKLVPVSHRNLLAMAHRMEYCFELSHVDRCACLLPLYYAQGIKSACIVPLLLGGSIAIPQAPVLDTLETWLSELQPTWFPAGPTFLQAVLERVRGNSALRHNLRFLISGSASLPEQVRTGVEDTLGIPLLDAWGMTEIGLLTGNSIRPEERKPGTVGYGFPDEVAIMAPDGRLCDADEKGEVVVRGPAVLAQYIDDDALNRDAFSAGWFHTGDLGSIDSDGYLTIAGRLKEIINRGGEKISPDLIERALRRHPAVREAAAFAVPHPRLGEDVAAAVVLQSFANPAAADLQSFLSAGLPMQMIPRSIFFVAALPKGPTGKILRKELSASCRPFADRTPAPPESETETQLLTIWQRLLQRPDIGIDDDFFAAGGDSLLAAQMLLDAERVTRKLLRGGILPVPATIRSLAKAAIAAEPLADDALTVRIDGARSGAPFFYCHGDYMFGGRYAYRLAELSGGSQTFWLLNNYNLTDSRGVPTIEELAAGYMPAILAAQPAGPFRLGGHCNGGLMSMELARQLSAIGREVEVIILIEPISLNARPAFRTIARTLEALVAVIPDRKLGRVIRAAIMFQFWRAFRWVCERLGLNSPSEDDPASWALESRQTRLVYQRLMANYIPSPTRARIVCLTAAGSTRAVEFDWKPWKRLSPDVVARVIPGNHISCLTTHIETLAKNMTEALKSGNHAENYAENLRHAS